MILKAIHWLLRRRNYCNMCMSRGVRIGFKCSHGHITCKECVSVGVKECQHHFCTDTHKYFEPKVNPLRDTLERLMNENRELRNVIDREPPAPIIVEPYQPYQPPIPVWQGQEYPPRQGNYQHTYGGTSGADTNTVTWSYMGSTSANASD